MWQPALHNLHLFTVHICRRTKLKRSWRAPWRLPLASRRRCLRGWLQIQSPVWKGWPGIFWNDSICAYSLPGIACYGFLKRILWPRTAHVALSPASLGNLKDGVAQHFASHTNRYHPALHGILLGYRSEDDAMLLDDVLKKVDV